MGREPTEHARLYKQRAARLIYISNKNRLQNSKWHTRQRGASREKPRGAQILINASHLKQWALRYLEEFAGPLG